MTLSRYKRKKSSTLIEVKVLLCYYVGGLLKTVHSHYLCAITSISTSPPFGRVLTATAERAGKAPEKCFS